MKNINRRKVLKSMLTVGFLGVLSPSRGMETIQLLDEKTKDISNKILSEKVKNKLLQERLKARRRTRRMIMNNDGNDMNITDTGEVTIEDFLKKRTSALVDSHVDSIFYCTGVNNVYSQLSNVTELPEPNAKAMHLIRTLEKKGTDTLSVMIDFCRKNKKEIFWSMRMNDNHDATRPHLLSKFKQEHPECLVGVKGERMPKMPNKWSALDYGNELVRNLAINTFNDVVSRYDVDGIELDFFRHPAFFKAQFYDEKITQEDCDKITEMLRKIRKICDVESIKKKHPILIAIRIPDSIGFSKAIGLDVEQWLEEGLIDIMSNGDYFKLEPWSTFCALGHKYKVPVYACLEQRRLSGKKDTETKSIVELWRGEASVAWQAGVNGIYTFNRFKPTDSIFRELGDPLLLSKLPMTKQESGIGDTGYHDPEYWLTGGREFYKEGNVHYD